MRKQVVRFARALRHLVTPRHFDHTIHVLSVLRGQFPRRCPGCGFVGLFFAEGIPPRLDACCPTCGSLERHRQLILCDQRQGLFERTHDVLHFAAEEALVRYVKPRVRSYLRADIRSKRADRVENIENLSADDASFDRVICSHVLEHVNDTKAMAGLFRILRPGGILLTMVPLIDAWEHTYENAAVTTPAGRILHFGADDHIRFYGRDFVDRLAAAGFTVTQVIAEGQDVVDYGLFRGESVFICRKPAAGSV